MTTKPLLAFLSAYLLVGCASQYPVSTATTSPKDTCAVTVIQAEKVLQSSMNGRIRYYDLKDLPFRFEVPSAACSPSIGVFLSPKDFQYVAESPFVATTTGFSMAGSEDTNDVLFFRSENPRLINGFENMFDSSEKEFSALCEEFGQCPLKIRAYRTYWNFLGKNGETKTYADFKRLTTEKPIVGYRGDISVVVYTKVKDVAGGYISTMKTHPIVLRFRP